MPHCEEKDRLLNAYTTAAEVMFDAVTELNQKAGKLKKAEYQALYRTSEDAHSQVESARLAHERRVQDHGC